MFREASVEGNAMGVAIAKKHGLTLKMLLAQATALVDYPHMTVDEKKDSLLGIAQKLSDIVTPETPCKNGCSHCCYMATAISRFEAKMISRHTGRALATQGSITDFLLGNGGVDKYAGVPCTFLKDGKCSIYVVRPLACRLHHNLAPTSDNCKITKDLSVAKGTDRLNFTAVDFAFVDLVMSSNDAFADIREFFPSKD